MIFDFGILQRNLDTAAHSFCIYVNHKYIHLNSATNKNLE